MTARVFILYTGGTIGMKPITVSENLERDKKKALSPMPLSDFLSRLIVAVPELKFRDKVNNHLSISLKGETVELQFAALDKAIGLFLYYTE